MRAAIVTLGILLAGAAAGAPPAGLAQSIISICGGGAAVPSGVSAVAEGTVKAMAWAKAKLALVVVSAAAAETVGIR